MRNRQSRKLTGTRFFPSWLDEKPSGKMKAVKDLQNWLGALSKA